MGYEKRLKESIPKWDKAREIREVDFLPPAERRAFYDEIRRKERDKGRVFLRKDVD